MRKGPIFYAIDDCEKLSVITPYETVSTTSECTVTPGISVLVPTYNRKNFLPITLRSILQQTFTDFEILIMDDGSADRADEEICKVVSEFPGGENKVHLFRQKNSGPAVARNRLITAAKGKYIMFFDDDDMMLPQALQELFDFAEQQGGRKIVYCNYERINENGDVIGISEKDSQLPSGWLTEAIFKRTIVSTITVMIPREILNRTQIFFHPELRIFEDTYFFLQLSTHTEFVALNKILIQRRRHSAHTSTGKNAYFQLQAMLQLYHEPGMSERISKKVANARFAKQYYRSAKQADELPAKVDFLKLALPCDSSAKLYLN